MVPRGATWSNPSEFQLSTANSPPQKGRYAYIHRKKSTENSSCWGTVLALTELRKKHMAGTATNSSAATVSCAVADSDPSRGIQVILEVLHLQNRRVLLNTAVNRKELQRRKASLFLHWPNLGHTVNISANTYLHKCNEITVSVCAGAMQTCHYVFTSLSKGSHIQKIHSFLYTFCWWKNPDRFHLTLEHSFWIFSEQNSQWDAPQP